VIHFLAASVPSLIYIFDMPNDKLSRAGHKTPGNMMRCNRRRLVRLVGRDGLKRARHAGKRESQNVFCFEASTPAWLLPPMTGFDSCA
jgi:hypothetical protein